MLRSDRKIPFTTTANVAILDVSLTSGVDKKYRNMLGTVTGKSWYLDRRDSARLTPASAHTVFREGFYRSALFTEVVESPSLLPSQY